MANTIWVHTVNPIPFDMLDHYKLSIKDYLKIIGYTFRRVIAYGPNGYMQIVHEFTNWAMANQGFEHYSDEDAMCTEMLLDCIERETRLLDSRRPDDTYLVDIMGTLGNSLYLTVFNETDNHSL